MSKLTIWFNKEFNYILLIEGSSDLYDLWFIYDECEKWLFLGDL